MHVKLRINTISDRATKPTPFQEESLKLYWWVVLGWSTVTMNLPCPLNRAISQLLMSNVEDLL